MFKRLTATIFQSILKRRDTKIFLSFCLLPILVPFLAGNLEGLNTDYTNSFGYYAFNTVSFNDTSANFLNINIFCF